MKPGQTARIVSKLLTVRLLRKRIPVTIGWCITYRCNLNCAYCGRSSIQLDEISTEEALQLVDEMADAGVEVVALGGGEPLLREDLGAIARRMKEKGFYISLDTNGTLISKQEPAVKYFDLVKVSLDGPRDITDETRGRECFDRALQGFRIAKEWVGNTTIGVVLNSANVCRIHELFDLADELSTRVLFQPVSKAHNIGKDLSGLLPGRAEYNRCITSIIEAKKKRNVVVNSVASLQYLRAYPDTPTIRCFAGYGIGRVAPDGQVYPCTIKGENARWSRFQDVGFLEAFKRIPTINCSQCWCSSTLDFNLLLSPNPSAFAGFFARVWLRPFTSRARGT